MYYTITIVIIIIIIIFIYPNPGHTCFQMASYYTIMWQFNKFSGGLDRAHLRKPKKEQGEDENMEIMT